jgi:BNR repeat-like domain
MHQRQLGQGIPAPLTRHTAGLVVAAIAWLPLCGGFAETDESPYTVAPGLFDQDETDLGLRAADGTETFTVFAPSDDTDKFSNGAVPIGFKGRLYVQWQSSARDEDSPDTWVAYSVSEDGESWGAPAVLAPAGEGIEMHSNGGWWTDGKTLVAYINVWPTGFQSGDGGYTEYRLSTDGQSWSEPRRVIGEDGTPIDGNLPDGTAYLVNSPRAGRERIPLAVTLSADGKVFDRSFLLRGASDLQPLRYEGRHKRPGYHYPKSVVAGGFLYVAYATNKEDVQVMRVPLSSLHR